MSMNNKYKKKLQYGSISVVMVIVFIAVIVLGNMGVGYLTDRFNLKFDMSAEGLYDISEQTETMLKNLKSPVTAYILLSENEVDNTNGYAQANELLKRYSTLSDGMFKVEYVDVYKNPTFTKKYETTGTLPKGTIVIESDKRFKTMELLDLYEISTNYNQSTGKQSQYISGFAADQAFASGLHYVTTEQLPTVVKIAGHGELYDEAFIAMLTSNNYALSEVNIALEDIPADTDLILVGTPNGDYTEEEIAKIDAYLNDNAGNAMVFSDVEALEMPIFDRYFSEWGVEYKTTMVLDDERAMNSQSWIVADILSNDLTKDLTFNANTIILAPYSRAIDVLWQERGSRTTSVILESSASSYGKSYSAGSVKVDSLNRADGDAAGPYPICVLSTQTKYVNNESKNSNVLFFSTSAITNSMMLNQQSMFNSKFLISAINYLNPVVEAVSIEAKSYTDTSLVILAETANVIMVVLVIVLPLIILGFGLFIWLRRKNK